MRKGIVKIDGRVLTVSSSVKTVGIVLDDILTFSDHITYNIQKMFGRLRGLYRFRGLLPEPAKLHLVQTLIHSISQFWCCTVFGTRMSRETLEEFEYCRTSPSVLCTRSGGTIGCPPSARKPICCWWKQYAGYRRTVKPTRSLHQESLVQFTFGRGFNSRRR